MAKSDEVMVERLAEKHEVEFGSKGIVMGVANRQARWWLNAIANDPSCGPIVAEWLRGKASTGEER